MKFKDIALRTGVKMSAISMILLRWKKDKFRLVERRSPGAEKRLKPSMVEYMCNPKVLKEMQSLTLVQRALQIKRKFNLPSLNAATVRNYYLQHGVKYRVPQYDYRVKAIQQHNLTEKQQEYVRTVAEEMKNGRHLIYIDETSFHRWQYKRKQWVTANMSVQIPNTRG